MAKRKNPTRKAKAMETDSVTEANETKRDKFLRLGKARVSATLGKLSLIGNLSSPNYEYTSDDVEKIKTVLHNATDNVLARFVPRKAEDRNKARQFDWTE